METKIDRLIADLESFRDAKIARMKAETEHEFGLAHAVLGRVFADWDPDELYLDLNRLRRDLNVEMDLTCDRDEDEIRDVFKVAAQVLRLAAQNNPEYFEQHQEEPQEAPSTCAKEEAVLAENGPIFEPEAVTLPAPPVVEEMTDEKEPEPEPPLSEQEVADLVQDLEEAGFIEPVESEDDKPEPDGCAVSDAPPPKESLVVTSGKKRPYHGAMERLGKDVSQKALGMLVKANEDGQWISFVNVCHECFGMDASDEEKYRLRYLFKTLSDGGYIDNNGKKTRGVKYMGSGNLMLLAANGN
jgi:hypothetical protein